MGILTGGERQRVREMFARGNLIYLRGMSVEKILFIAKQWRHAGSGMDHWKPFDM